MHLHVPDVTQSELGSYNKRLYTASYNKKCKLQYSLGDQLAVQMSTDTTSTHQVHMHPVSGVQVLPAKLQATNG
jgi:hypothetical protein